MHIRKKGVRKTEEVFDVDGKKIEVVEKFKYLGCVVDICNVNGDAGWVSVAVWGKGVEWGRST